MMLRLGTLCRRPLCRPQPIESRHETLNRHQSLAPMADQIVDEPHLDDSEAVA
jgi:hypothetical protein